MSDLEIREVQIRAHDDERREVTGIAVPYGQDTSIGGYYTERFEKGAVQDSEGALLMWRHEEVIGKLVKHRDTGDGWEITAKISKTLRGDEAWILVRDGVIDKFSVGFEPVEHVTDDESGTVVRTKVRVREVSLVPFPAYQGAEVSQVREAQNKREESPVSNEETVTKADLLEVRESMEDLARLVETGNKGGEERELDLALQFRSFGDYVKQVASGDEAAVKAANDLIARAWTPAGAVLADTVAKPGWVGDVIRLGQERQRIASTFQHTYDLPAEGNTVEYAQLKSDSTQVAVQAAEGDDLLFGKVAIETKSAPVRTLGGWTSLSRQSIERSTVGVLDTTFLAMAIKYARAIEVLTRAAVTTALTTSEVVPGVITTQDGVLETLIDLVEHFEDSGLNFDGLLVSKDVFVSLLGVAATDRILQVSAAPTDKLGSVTVSSLEGDIAGVSVKLFPGAAAGTIVAYDRLAVRTQESAGAPFRLQDENIVNLTKDFSIYGYAASYVQIPDGLVVVDTTP